MPWSVRCFTTTRCVEMPAWSVPGKYKVLYPRIRCQRVRISISVCSSMCPMCSDPVTFGGGITIENTGPGSLASALNSASFTQKSAHRGSICCGSYAFAISRAINCTFSVYGRALARPSMPLRIVQSNPRLYEGKSGCVNSVGRSLAKKHSFLMTTKRNGSSNLWGGELRLLRLHLFFDHRFHNGLQNLSRNRLQNLRTHPREYLGNELVHVAFGLGGLGGLVSRVEAFTGGLFLRHMRRVFGNVSGLLADGLNSGRGQGHLLSHVPGRFAGGLCTFLRSVR